MTVLSLDKQNTVKTDRQLEQLISQAIAKETALTELSVIREQALEKLKHSRLPNKRDEEWQFTDLDGFKSITFHSPTPVDLDIELAKNFYLAEAPNSRLVFVNGFFAPQLSDRDGLPKSLTCGNWQQLTPNQRKKCAGYLAKQGDQSDVFSALNTSGLQDVAVVWIPANVAVETPIHCLFLTVADTTPALINPRLLVVAEANAQCQLVESYGAITQNCSDFPQQQPYCNNVVNEIILGDNAQVTHLRNQRDSGDSFHLAQTTIVQARDSHYRLFDINLGAKLSRHTPQMEQQGENTQTDFIALTAIAGRQVSDTHSSIHLQFPHGTTHQLHKCIVDEFAHAVFNGKVFVPQAAQLTNANQLNRNLLLSPKARVNTKPELQIIADNVKCTHGATISQLEADEIFYLRSRGLNDYDARHLLLDAFAGEILDQVPIPSLQQRLRQCIACRTI